MIWKRKILLPQGNMIVWKQRVCILNIAIKNNRHYNLLRSHAFWSFLCFNIDKNSKDPFLKLLGFLRPLPCE